MTEDNNEVTWWMKIVLQVIGTLGGLICLIGGLIGLIEAPIHITEPLWILSDAIMFILGFVMVCFECTFICKYVNIADPVTSRVDRIKERLFA